VESGEWRVYYRGFCEGLLLLSGVHFDSLAVS